LAAVARARIISAPAVVAAGAPPAYGSTVARPIATPLAYAAPAVAKVAAVDTDYDPNPQYSYAYDIQDALTGDAKSPMEQCVPWSARLIPSTDSTPSCTRLRLPPPWLRSLSQQQSPHWLPPWVRPPVSTLRLSTVTYTPNISL
jgi:hypothetical protein